MKMYLLHAILYQEYREYIFMVKAAILFEKTKTALECLMFMIVT